VDYAILKAVHVASAALSIAGFAARGVLMLRDSLWLESKFARIVPHAVDTVLLGSAIALAWMSGQYPFAQDWLTAKGLALIVYIVLGSIALRRGRSKAVRAVAFALALGVVLYLLSVAITRNARGIFSIFSIN
jgi:uncharacterized membrane protein SirB2